MGLSRQKGIERKQTSDYYIAKLKQKEKENQSLQKQIQALKHEKKALVKSLSFKIGYLITLPIRALFRLFQVKKNTTINNPIKASCDTAIYSSKLLEVTGWALSDTKIVKIELYLGKYLVKTAQLGMFREDVMQAFPDTVNSHLSGFELRLAQEVTKDSVLLKIFDEKGYCVELKKIIIPAIHEMSLNAQYQIFRQKITKQKFDLQSFEYHPLISIIVPVYNVIPKWLNLCIESVLKQNYPQWQLCIYDDASTNKQTLECLKKWKNKDDRISIQFGSDNGGIAFASNQAIDLARGEYIALLDNDDELSSDALYQVVSALNQDRDLDFIYSDEDKIDEQGELCDPHFKSDFNLDALLSWNYICHFSVIRRSMHKKLGQWFRSGYDGSQDYDLFLRIIENTDKIQHIPKVLYHWRKTENSTATDLANKDYAMDSSKKALSSYLKRQNISGEIISGLFTNSFRIKRDIQAESLVSIIIPFRDGLQLLQTCIESILSKTSYCTYEILLIDNRSTDALIIKYCKQLTEKHQKIQTYIFDNAFNYAQINNWAVERAQGDYILFLNNDTQVINAGWLTAMVEHIQRDKVAAVGAKLLYADNTIQHSGVVVSAIGAVHSNKNMEDTTQGYFQRPHYIQNISVCTAACLLVKKSVFLEVKGFDQTQFKIAYNDVDLCLKIRQAGYLITYTPYAKLYHYESKSRGSDNVPEKIERFSKELSYYQQKWGQYYKEGDPYYNPNLRQTSEKVSLINPVT